jgi:hypothetical protein
VSSSCYSFEPPINQRVARAVAGATVALSTLWAGFVIFGPLSDERALRLAGASPHAELRRGDGALVRLITRLARHDTLGCGRAATRMTGS